MFFVLRASAWGVWSSELGGAALSNQSRKCTVYVGCKRAEISVCACVCGVWVCGRRQGCCGRCRAGRPGRADVHRWGGLESGGPVPSGASGGAGGWPGRAVFSRVRLRRFSTANVVGVSASRVSGCTSWHGRITPLPGRARESESSRSELGPGRLATHRAAPVRVGPIRALIPSYSESFYELFGVIFRVIPSHFTSYSESFSELFRVISDRILVPEAAGAQFLITAAGTAAAGPARRASNHHTRSGRVLD
jgi:hypothetical protein